MSEGHLSFGKKGFFSGLLLVLFVALTEVLGHVIFFVGPAGFFTLAGTRTSIVDREGEVPRPVSDLVGWNRSGEFAVRENGRCDRFTRCRQSR